MKRIIALFILLLVVGSIWYFDYREKKEKFYSLKREYDFSLSFEQAQSQINNFFFEHGWFPDSLQQADTIFNFKGRWNDFEEYRETPYRFIVDPFTYKFYHYIPVINKKHNKPEGYYLLSAGIDSKIDSKNNKESLKLYDSAYFNYLDYYFGKKDLLVSEGSIDNWIESSGREFSLKDMMRKYDPSGRRILPRNVKFYGIVDSVSTDHFLVKDTQSTLRGVCYLAPSVGELAVVAGDIVQVKGLYNKITFEADTAFTFLNCVILEKR